MAQPILQQQIERLLTVVEKPSRYIGGETNETVKPDATVCVALSYPDADEIGISNQALQILYSLINDRTDAAAERVYCPRPELADAMRRELKGRQLKLSLHDDRTSMLEGAIGRGDAITGDVLEAAWRAGARFDASTEHHREDAWQAAFTAAGRDLEVEATRERNPLDPLPWDHVRSGVTKEFLLDEWWQSRAERPTGACRWDGCSDCGACVGPVRNRLVEA